MWSGKGVADKSVGQVPDVDHHDKVVGREGLLQEVVRSGIEELHSPILSAHADDNCRGQVVPKPMGEFKTVHAGHIVIGDNVVTGLGQSP